MFTPSRRFLIAQILLTCLGACVAQTGTAGQLVTWNIEGTPADLTNIVGVASGGTHWLALTEDGRVRGWGLNEKGQISFPADLTNVTAIAASPGRSVVLTGDGTVRCFGVRSQVPAGLSNVVAIAAGQVHTLALLSNGTVVGWAERTDSMDNYREEQVPPDLINVVAIDAYRYRSMALTAEGKIVMWGDTGNLIPPSGYTNLVGICDGNTHTLALTAEGNVLGWGNIYTPDLVMPPNPGKIVSISAGGGTAGAIRADGFLLAWGNTNGVPAGLTDVQAVSVRDGGMAILKGGAPRITSPSIHRTVLAGASTHLRATAVGSEPLSFQWRFNGTDLPNATNSVLSLAQIAPGQSGAYSVVVSNQQGVATSAPMTVDVWSIIPPIWSTHPQTTSTYLHGTISLQAGAGGSTPISYQWRFNGTNIAGATATTLTLTNLALEQAGFYSVVASNAAGVTESESAFLSVGLVVAWGGSHYPTKTPLAVALPHGLSNTVNISASGFNNVALKDDGTVIGWGAENIIPPPGLSNVMAVSAGWTHSMALKADGTVVVWGAQTWVPPTLTNVIAIDGGKNFSMALQENGLLYSWDLDTNVTTLTNVVTMAGGWAQFALTADGKVTEWGGWLSTRQVPKLTNVVALAGGDKMGLALQSDGNVAMWGTDPPLAQPGDPYFPATNCVAIAGGGGEHATSIYMDANGKLTGYLWWPPGAVINEEMVGVSAGTDHYIALLKNPRGTNSLRLRTVFNQPTSNSGVQLTGIVGQRPVLVESTTNLHEWQPVITNWPSATTWLIRELPQSGAASQFFRAKQ